MTAENKLETKTSSCQQFYILVFLIFTFIINMYIYVKRYVHRDVGPQTLELFDFLRFLSQVLNSGAKQEQYMLPTTELSSPTYS